MAYNLRNRSFLKEIDFTPAQLRYLLKLAKYAGTEVKCLEGKEIALIFEKTSTRTRSAFEVAAYDQGGHVIYLDPAGSQLGHKESIADTAAVLGRMYDAIEFRVASADQGSGSERTGARKPSGNSLQQRHGEPRHQRAVRPAARDLPARHGGLCGLIGWRHRAAAAVSGDRGGTLRAYVQGID